MCGGGTDDSGSMGIDDDVQAQSDVSGLTSTVGDDSDDDSTNITPVDFNPVDDSTAISGLGGNPGIGNQINNTANTTADMDQDVSAGLNILSGSNLSQAAIDSARTDQSQTPDSQSFFASTIQPEPMDFNIIGTDQNPTAASRDLRQRADQGSFPNAFTPFGAAINALSKIGPQNTLNDLNRGFAPTYSGGQITGTTGTGFGMENIPGYEPFAPVVPSTNVPMDMGDDGNEQTILRRNPPDPREEEPTAPPVSDQLATDFLQNPFFLYSGQGNLYQPYGYAQNTLVDLLRTRNMTQPQQAAANLGLFGNPGDFL